MAEFFRDSKNNTLSFYWGFHKSSQLPEQEFLPVEGVDTELILSRRRVIGVRLKNFFTRLELASYEAENELKRFLERHHLESLYLGLSVEMQERKENFFLNIGNERPDFLVRLPAFGTLFWDLKCRPLVGGERFLLACEELEALERIQNNLALPVWLLLLDSNLFELERGRFKAPSFYVAPLSSLLAYYRELGNLAKSKLSGSLPLPRALFSPLGSWPQLSGFAGSLNREQLQAELAFLGQRKQQMQQLLLERVAKEPLFRSYLPYQICAEGEYPVLPLDLMLWVRELIEQGLISYEKGKPLQAVANLKTS